MKTFKALVVTEKEPNVFSREVKDVQMDFLPDNDVLIEVKYSGLNFKDALSASGNKGVTKKYPHIPGIDAAGVVIEDRTGAFTKGDEVIVTSYDLGMNTPGGFGEYIKVPADWVVPMPEGLDMKESMILGTAGLTAGIGVYKMLINGLKPSGGKILVTGATGGVGSFAVAILAGEGFKVIASTGKKDVETFLRDLGADEIIGREEVDETSGRPLLKPRWAGAIDNVGGNTLATALKACSKDGVVIAVGLVASPKLDTTVYPFILNGVSLMGVASATCDMDLRQEVWNKLALEWKPANLNSLARIIKLDELNDHIDTILQGGVTGRVVVSF